MSKRLYTCSKIFFPNPYVVRVDHDDGNPLIYGQAPASFTKLTSRTRKLIHGTWGFSSFEYEKVRAGKDDNANAIAQGTLIASRFGPDYQQICRSYWCFKDEEDALLFRLMLDKAAMQVQLWPARLFTIYELVEEK